MGREFVTEKIKKIVNNKQFKFPQNMAMAAAWILGNLKGVDLKIFDLKSNNDLCDYYVVGSAASTVQARAMADEILFHLKQYGCSVHSKEGFENSEWVLIDLKDIIVHIFLEDTRKAYALEKLWKRARVLEIPSEYYFSFEETSNISLKTNEKKRDFF